MAGSPGRRNMHYSWMGHVQLYGYDKFTEDNIPWVRKSRDGGQSLADNTGTNPATNQTPETTPFTNNFHSCIRGWGVKVASFGSMKIHQSMNKNPASTTFLGWSSAMGQKLKAAFLLQLGSVLSCVYKIFGCQSALLFTNPWSPLDVTIAPNISTKWFITVLWLPHGGFRTI